MGGGAVYAERLCQAMVKQGAEIHIITSGNDLKYSVKEENGLVIHKIPNLQLPLTRFSSFSLSLMKYYKLISKATGGFDIIHGNGLSDFILDKRFVNLPRVTTIHHLSNPLVEGKSILFRIRNFAGEAGVSSGLEGSVIKRANSIVAVSDYTKNVLAAKFGNFSFSKVHVIYNGVDLEDFNIPNEECESIRDSFKLNDSFVFLSAGRVDDNRKDIPLLLRAFQLAKKNVSNIKLLIVGRGRQERIWTLAKTLGISKDIIMPGFVSDSLLRKLYCVSNVYISTSILEGFGLTVVEGMAAGKPVLAPNAGAIPEIVKNNVNGLLFVDRSPLSVSKAMCFYYDKEELAFQVGRSNKQYVKDEFNWNEAAIKTQSVYKETCDRLNFT